jgi:hypothetical protein
MQMRIQDYLDIVLMVIGCEAIVNLIFTGVVLQPVRDWIIRHTPFISVNGEHLLSCRVCTSLWIGFLCAIGFLFLSIPLVRFIFLGIVIHRLSNHFHLIFSIIRDIQLDMRVARNK